MEWYRYNPETFEYEHPVICQPNPARPGEYLIPPSATPLEPPKVESKQIAQFDTNLKQWSIQPDYRGTEYWLSDGSQHKIEVIGEVPPDDALYEQPPDMHSIFITNGQARKDRIEQQAEADAKDRFQLMQRQIAQLQATVQQLSEA